MKIDKTGSIQFADDHKRVNQDSHSRVHKNKSDKSFLPQFGFTKIKAFGVQNQCLDPNRMSVAGTQKKAPRFSEIAVVPEGENLVLTSVFSLSTWGALSAEAANPPQKTSETMGGTTTVSPLLFMNNLQKLIVEANKNNKKRSLDAVGVENTTPVEPHNKRGPRH